MVDGGTSVETGANSLRARCERWLELNVTELANDVVEQAIAVTVPPPVPSPPYPCPCLEDARAYPQVRVNTPHVLPEGSLAHARVR